MDQLDEQIRAARERSRRRDQLTRQRETLQAQIAEVTRLLEDLEQQLTKEDRDVAKLEKGGFGSLLAGLTGNREEKLTRERAEAAAARERVNGQRARRGWLAQDLRAVEEELRQVAAAQRELAVLLERKERVLIAVGDHRGRALSDLARQLADCDADLREHQEAHEAGVAAGHAVGHVLRCLGSARGASTFDMFGFGGGLADMVEHGHLRQADEAAWHAQRALDSFSRELADVGVTANPKLPKVDTRWFADMFFDNIITDALKHQRIARTGEAVQQTAQWVGGMVNELAGRCGELTRQREALLARREEMLSQ